MNLIKKNLIIMVLLYTTVVFCQRKKDLIKEIQSYEKGIVSNASFNNDYQEVWDAIYIIATEEYNTIRRESESRGYIEALQESDTFKEEMTIEIRGNESSYRVSFQVRQEKRYKNFDGTYTDWKTYNSSTLKRYYFRLQKRLYVLLNGSIELPLELRDKIDKYNSEQSNERKKVLKGRDY
ncbi:hypothetical protein [Gaetbulibacter jejuensis]|uniref:DUF4468 domain-containing protein n=1 Tax=Gaetbulibacter jejuensis TaxID=584607 RepID=A0ABN1JG75_9FLAO